MRQVADLTAATAVGHVSGDVGLAAVGRLLIAVRQARLTGAHRALGLDAFGFHHTGQLACLEAGPAVIRVGRRVDTGSSAVGRPGRAVSGASAAVADLLARAGIQAPPAVTVVLESIDLAAVEHIAVAVCPVGGTGDDGAGAIGTTGFFHARQYAAATAGAAVGRVGTQVRLTAVGRIPVAIAQSGNAGVDPAAARLAADV